MDVNEEYEKTHENQILMSSLLIEMGTLHQDFMAWVVSLDLDFGSKLNIISLF